MDRGVVKTRKDLELLLKNIADRHVDIVIGTQMVTKGHDFPGISLVGILMADASLNLPDFRAYEKTFQVITQVSGRAGRAEIPGEVIIQTLNPEHPILRAAADHRFEEFYRMELAGREQFGFPPFQRAVMLRFQHSNPRKVEEFAFKAVEYLRASAVGIAHERARSIGKAPESAIPARILGPAESPLSRLKKMYRWQCMVKSDSVREVQGLLRKLAEWVKLQKSAVQFAADVDPVNLL